VVADSAELCGGKNDAEQTKNDSAGQTYIPDAYKAPTGDFEEMKSEEDLPF
jgi:hypothetical protein